MLHASKSGFTLIELLIVIVIIGILATIGIYMSIGKVAQSRDAVRKSDLNQIKKALEFAKSECKTGVWYPLKAATAATPKTKYDDATLGLAIYLSDPDLKHLKSPLYDPKNNATYYYGYSVNVTGSGQYSTLVCPDVDTAPNIVSGSKDYRLTVTLEKTNDPDIAKSKAKCPWSSDFTGLSDYSASTSYVYVVCPN